MTFIDRLERNIAKLEKRIEKEQIRIGRLKEKCDSKKITKAKFNIEKRKIEEKIKAMNSRIRVLQGGMTKEEIDVYVSRCENWRYHKSLL